MNEAENQLLLARQEIEELREMARRWQAVADERAREVVELRMELALARTGWHWPPEADIEREREATRRSL